MKQGVSAVLAVILMISMSACTRDAEKKIDKRYRDLQSYTARVRVTVSANKGTQAYVLSQSFRAPDQYRSEVTEPERMRGTVTVIQGDTVWYRGADAPIMRMEDGAVREEKDVLFLHDFLTEYYQNEDRPTLTINQEGMVLLSAPRRGDRYRFAQELWIDAKSNLPCSLITYDEKGDERLRVEYESFQPGVALSDSVFLP